MQRLKIAVIEKGPYQWWRLATVLFYCFMFSSLAVCGFLVYNYTFNTLEYERTIVVLNAIPVVNNNLNMENYDKAVEIMEQKTTSTFPQNLRNVFKFTGSVATSTYAGLLIPATSTYEDEQPLPENSETGTP